MPAPVQLWDRAAVKRVVDDALIQCMEAEGWKEDHAVGNVKLLLGGLACVAALVGQFFPEPFPESRPVLILCCVLYFALAAAMNGVAWISGRRNCVLRTKLPMRIEVRSTSPGVTDPAIKVEFVDRDSGRTKAQDEIKVFEFFDADGKFLQNAFSKRVREILGELRAADDRKHS